MTDHITVEGETDDAPNRMPVSARGKRTRAKLLDSGRDAVIERGPRDTRVDDVVRRAGTSHGTFYLYFENVEDLLGTLIDECDEETAAVLTRLRTAGPVDLGPTAAVVLQVAKIHRHYGSLASPWVDAAPGLGEGRLERLRAALGDGEPALAVLALLDRLAPGVQTDEDARRVATAVAKHLPVVGVPAAP